MNLLEARKAYDAALHTDRVAHSPATSAAYFAAARALLAAGKNGASK